MSPELAELAHRAGIWADFVDQTGERRVTGAETAVALLGGMGLPAGSEAEVRESLAALRAEAEGRRLPPWAVIEAERPATLGQGEFGAARLTLEDGTETELPPAAPLHLPPLPLGIHRLDAGGETVVLLAAPARLPLPPRAWGVTLPLYGLKPGGLGDFDDLGRALEALAGHGAAFAGINPIHAGFFPHTREISPYAPSHRRRLNPAYLSVAGEVPVPGDLVDYEAAFAARWAALRAAFAAGEDRGAAFEAWRRAQGPDLELFATHQALSEMHGPYWTEWPEALRVPASEAVRAHAAAHGEARAFHAWAQFRTERALGDLARRASTMTFGLYLDIAVGTHPAGAETWGEPAAFAAGVSLGAPPDAFSREGQVWGLAPLNPRRLVTDAFRPVAEMLRKQLAFARLIRIDHVLGFERSFWIPSQAGLPGAYVTMPRDALLAVARIEAARAGASVIGEDLGNVPDGLRDALDASGVMGCRVAMFEFGHDLRVTPPGEYQEAALASFGTHDLPTWAGWRKGRDIALRHALGAIDDAAAAGAQAHRAAEVAAFDAAAPGADQPTAFLAETRARLVALQIEDILEVTDQPNLPGTVDEHPNWRRRVPVPPADWAGEPRLAQAARLMRAAGREEDAWND